jgi:hypothetical protein
MNVGVIADGPTDRRILFKIVECFIPCVNKIELTRLKFRSAIDDYWSASNTNNFWFPNESAKNLSSDVLRILLSAFKEFGSHVGGLTEDDILIASTDSECYLANSDKYFDSWAFSLTKIFISGVESFYHTMLRQGRGKENLPLIIPIVPFPSTDILIAAARNMSGYYGRKPNELKTMLYGNDNLRTIPPEDFEDKALKYITSDSINLIFKNIPESRPFINFLSAIARIG